MDHDALGHRTRLDGLVVLGDPEGEGEIAHQLHRPRPRLEAPGLVTEERGLAPHLAKVCSRPGDAFHRDGRGREREPGDTAWSLGGQRRADEERACN
jgi:hypothetical protein